MHRTPRIGEAEREQGALHRLPAQAVHHVPEIDLGLPSGAVGLRDEHLGRRSARLLRDLRAPGADVGQEDVVGHLFGQADPIAR
ncbi:hypothetical protein [Segniliparus rotundus]|uniref:hypothetical protein n=1 Tax=Segniliparus rotundus TaxID=286802 RepID=UPI0011D04A23